MIIQTLVIFGVEEIILTCETHDDKTNPIQIGVTSDLDLRGLCNLIKISFLFHQFQPGSDLMMRKLCQRKNNMIKKTPVEIAVA